MRSAWQSIFPDVPTDAPDVIVRGCGKMKERE